MKQDRIIDYRTSDQFSRLIDSQREIQARTQSNGFVMDKNLVNRKTDQRMTSAVAK